MKPLTALNLILLGTLYAPTVHAQHSYLFSDESPVASQPEIDQPYDQPLTGLLIGCTEDSPCNSQTPDSAADWKWGDSLELFGGLDGSKQPQDFGVNAHFGSRLHANWGIPLFQEQGIGLQIGSAITLTDHAVAVTKTIEGSSSRTQSFTTLGVFQRTDSGWVWAIANDLLYQNDYDQHLLDQWRGKLGYQVTSRDEMGVMGALPQSGADAVWAGVPVRLDPLAQGSFYWRHHWDFGGQTTGWLGVADNHGQANAALGDRPETSEVILFGADVQLPLNDYLALFGEANFVSPADTGTVDAYLGIVFYPGGGAVGWRNRKWSPVLPVASNPSFVTNLIR